jgi:exopolysaccharide biosynthesis polyprenyl glycosylphosphotransferase
MATSETNSGRTIDKGAGGLRAFPVLMAGGDVLVVVSIFLLGYWIRHEVLADVLFRWFGMDPGFRLSLWNYFVSGAVMGVIEVMMLQAFGVYRQQYGLAHIEEMAWILRSSFIAVVVTFAFTFATRQLYFSRFVLLFAFPASSVSVAVWHWIVHRLYRNLAKRSGRTVKVAIYGTGSLARDIGRFMQTKASIPYEIVGRIPGYGEEDAEGEEVTQENLFEWLHQRSATELILADPKAPKEHIADLVYRCEEHGFSYKLVADVFALVRLTTRITHMGGTTMIESVPSPLSGPRRIPKRIMDLVFSGLFIVLLSPLLALISLAIVVDTGFPVLYRQTRLGRNNARFTLLKFRSMRKGADKERAELEDMNEASGPLFKMKKDPRITLVGRAIRRYSLDELPQLFNVFAGRMSLVGPRPPLPGEVQRYSQRHLKRLQVLPGMTGVWQISGRSNLNFDEMIKLDLYYVDNWSIWMDLSILLLTIPAILTGRGAY